MQLPISFLFDNALTAPMTTNNSQKQTMALIFSKKIIKIIIL